MQHLNLQTVVGVELATARFAAGERALLRLARARPGRFRVLSHTPGVAVQIADVGRGGPWRNLGGCCISALRPWLPTTGGGAGGARARTLTLRCGDALSEELLPEVTSAEVVGFEVGRPSSSFESV